MSLTPLASVGANSGIVRRRSAFLGFHSLLGFSRREFRNREAVFITSNRVADKRSFSRREFRNREAARSHRSFDTGRASFSRREFRNREADREIQRLVRLRWKLQSARIQES